LNIYFKNETHTMNNKMIGRGAEFKYLHTHDIFAKAVNYINFLSQE